MPKGPFFVGAEGLGEFFAGKKVDTEDVEGLEGWFPSDCVGPLKRPVVRQPDADLAGGKAWPARCFENF